MLENYFFGTKVAHINEYKEGITICGQLRP
jgi:hypothetical protein